MRFILIDRIIEIEKEKSAKGIKNLAMSEDYFQHHFPFFPIMPGTLMLESMVQLSSWLSLYSTEFVSFGLLSKLDRAKFRRAVQPGDRLEVSVEWVETTDTGIVTLGRASSEGKSIVEAKFEMRLLETEREQRASLENLFRFLTTRFSPKDSGRGK